MTLDIARGAGSGRRIWRGRQAGSGPVAGRATLGGAGPMTACCSSASALARWRG